MLDKFARECGLAFPGGPILEKLARDGKTLLALPYSVKGMDVAFSGMLTAALALRKQGATMEDSAFSIQEVAFAMLTEVTERAMAHLDNEEVLLEGGVARNGRLQRMVARMASNAWNPASRSSKSQMPMWPIRKIWPFRGPCPPATTVPCFSRSSFRKALSSTPTGYRTAVTVFDAKRRSGNNRRSSASNPALAASASRRVRAIRFSSPSSLNMRNASRNARKSGTAGVNGVSCFASASAWAFRFV